MQADVQIRTGESRMYVNHHRGTGFSVLDGETGMFLTRVPIGRSPHGITVSPDGAHVFVANQLDDTVSVVDARSHQLVQTFPVGKEPMQLVVSRDGASLYVAAKGNGVVDVLDLARGARKARIPVGRSPHQLILSRDGGTLFVTVEGEDDEQYPPPTLLAMPGLAAEVVDISARPGTDLLRFDALFVETGSDQRVLVDERARLRESRDDRADLRPRRRRDATKFLLNLPRVASQHATNQRGDNT